jgi:D-sedoheptulose 7-phosphate isomerase
MNQTLAGRAPDDSEEAGMAGDNQRAHLRNLTLQMFRESVRVKRDLCEGGLEVVLEMAEMLAQAFRGGHCLFLFGNGGSAADAQHLAAEFVNRFQSERPPLGALALTVDSSVLTSIANDYAFEEVFSKQLQALAHPGDVALGISTSGRSPNVVRALRWAREHAVRTIGWGGLEPAEMAVYCDLILHVPSSVTAHIQEAHITVGHVLCALVDEILFGESRSAP